MAFFSWTFMANFSRHYFGYFNLSVFGYFCLTLTLLVIHSTSFREYRKPRNVLAPLTRLFASGTYGKFVRRSVLQKSFIFLFHTKSSHSYCILFHKSSFIPWCKPTTVGRCSIKVAISRASSALCVHRAELVGDCIPKPQPPTPVSWKICLLCSLIFHSSA